MYDVSRFGLLVASALISLKASEVETTQAVYRARTNQFCIEDVVPVYGFVPFCVTRYGCKTDETLVQICRPAPSCSLK